MDYRQIISQNGMTLINYFNIDHIVTEKTSEQDLYIFAVTKISKVMLGRYNSEAVCRQIIECLNLWLSCELKFNLIPPFEQCSYESFIMPEDYQAGNVDNQLYTNFDKMVINTRPINNTKNTIREDLL